VRDVLRLIEAELHLDALRQLRFEACRCGENALPDFEDVVAVLLVRDVTVFENILLPLYPQPTGFAEMEERGRALLAMLGMEKKEQMKVSKLSGGEQQRVAIARALINDPEIIIADEPTAHLDSKLSADLLGILEDISRMGKTILIATHDPLVFNHPLIHRTISMRDGCIEGGSGQ
jgi:putative ABC transport system ATP-binding protein